MNPLRDSPTFSFEACVRTIGGSCLVTTSGEYVVLANYDAPEFGETNYEVSSNFLWNLVEGIVILVVREGKDLAGHTLAKVFIGHGCVNDIMHSVGSR